MSTFHPRGWKSPVTSGIRTAMAWRCGGPCPYDAAVKNLGHDDVAHIEFKTIPQAIRDLNLWEQPCFWIYQAPLPSLCAV